MGPDATWLWTKLDFMCITLRKATRTHEQAGSTCRMRIPWLPVRVRNCAIPQSSLMTNLTNTSKKVGLFVKQSLERTRGTTRLDNFCLVRDGHTAGTSSGVQEDTGACTQSVHFAKTGKWSQQTKLQHQKSLEDLRLQVPMFCAKRKTYMCSGVAKWMRNRSKAIREKNLMRYHSWSSLKKQKSKKAKKIIFIFAESSPKREPTFHDSLDRCCSGSTTCFAILHKRLGHHPNIVWSHECLRHNLQKHVWSFQNVPWHGEAIVSIKDATTSVLFSAHSVSEKWAPH